jgi:hypothetical protein
MVKRGRCIKDPIEEVKVGEQSRDAVGDNHWDAINQTLQPRAIGPTSGEGNDLKVIVNQ